MLRLLGARIASPVSHYWSKRATRLRCTLVLVFIGGGIVGLFLLLFWMWAIFDVISTDESLCRNLPKPMWLILVIFLWSVGAVAWLLLGRPENASFRIGDTSPRTSPGRAVGPEDSAGWAPADPERYTEMDAELDRRLEEKRLREWEDELRRRENELKRREASPED